MNKILYVLVILVITSCATGEMMGQISPGMTQDEVIGVLGKPDGFKQQDEYIAYTYTHRLISGFSNDRADYIFIFKNDSLVEYGAGAIREKNVNGVNTVILIPQ